MSGYGRVRRIFYPVKIAGQMGFSLANPISSCVVIQLLLTGKKLTKIQIISWADRGLSCIPSVRRIQRKNIYRGNPGTDPCFLSV
jgi:hypothetical protein